MNRRRRAPLVLRSVGSRPVIAVLLFILSAAAVLTSALGPLLVRAVHQSSLAAAVVAAGPSGSSVAASLKLGRGDDLGQGVQAVERVFVDADPARGAGLWQRPQLMVESTSSLSWATTGSTGDRQLVAEVAAGESGCAWLKIVSGRCPARVGETLVSSADLAASGARIGSVLAFSLLSSSVRSLHVVGIYDPGGSATIDLLRPNTLAGQLAQLSGDPLITTRAQLAAMNQGALITERLLLRKAMSVQDEPVARETIGRVQASTLLVSDFLVVFDSELPQLLDGVGQRVSSAAVLMVVTVAQAEVLALFALVIALQRLGRSRSAEWGVGRLRGMPWRPWLASIWLEPGSALLLGLPAGLGAAVASGTLIIGRALRPGTPVEWTHWPVLLAAVSTVAVAVVALVAVSIADIRRPLIELLQQTSDSRRVNVVAAVVQSGVVLLAAAALYQLASGQVIGGGGKQLALLAPVLFAFAIAAVAVRVAVVLVRRVTARPARSLVGLVVGRHAARTPSALNPAIVVAGGLALALFSTQVLALSVRNQGLRAQAIVGAATVLQVGTPAGVDLVQAVRTADPSGVHAMAVQEKAMSSDGGTSRIVAVDTSRLAAVAPWVAGWVETPELAKTLHPAETAPVMLHGSQVELDLSDVALTTSVVAGFTPPAVPPTLSLVVQHGAAGAWQTVSLGSLPNHAVRYAAPLPCQNGCRLVGIELYSGKGQTYDTAFTITQISTTTTTDDGTAASTKLQALFRRSGEWRQRVGGFTGPNRSQSITPTATTGGLRVKATDTDGNNHNWIVPTDSADPLPAVLAPGLRVEPFPGMASVAAGTGLDGQFQLIKVVGRASILPRALTDGVLVDLRDAQALSDPSADEATNEVWLNADAPASIEQSLTAHGITVLSREHIEDTRQTLLHQGNTRGAVAAVWVAMAGLLVGLLTLAGTRAADARKRRSDWSALRDTGVAPATIRKLAFVEIAVPAVLGAIVGIGSGVIATTLAVSRLPLVDAYAAGPPLDLHLAVGPILWLSGAALLVIAVVAAAGAHSETNVQDRV